MSITNGDLIFAVVMFGSGYLFGRIHRASITLSAWWSGHDAAMALWRRESEAMRRAARRHPAGKDVA